MMKFAVMVLCSLLTLSFANAQKEKVLGIWHTPEKEAKMNFYLDDGKLYGKIIWASKSEALDIENPDPALRDRKIVGLDLFQGFEWDSDDAEWENGKVYDPKSGKTYDCVVTIDENNEDQLNIRGYIMGMRWLGRSETFTRVK